jgi:hypothetical protein
VALVAALAACGPPERGTIGAAPLLYVANAQDGTVTVLEGASGRAVGAPRPAGPAPRQVVALADGGALVRSDAPGPTGGLTHVARESGGWAARPVALEPGARARLLAVDGDAAVVAYEEPPADADPVPEGNPARRCRLALVDPRTDTAAPTPPVCRAGETVVGLAVERTPGGPVAYLALAGRQGGGGPAAPAARGRVVMVAVDSGAALGSYPLAGPPQALVLAPGPGRRGRRLYCLQAPAGPTPGTVGAGGNGPPPAPDTGLWLLLGLDRDALRPVAAHALAEAPRALAVAPDGDRAYALSDAGGAGGAALLAVDLATGRAAGRTALPGEGAGLAVTAQRVYVADPRGDALWVVDRSGGALRPPVRVGRRPVDVAPGGV